MQRGDTQESLGEELGIAHTSVGRWLSGAIPRPSTLAILARRFGVSSVVLTDDAKPLPAIKPQRDETFIGYTRPVPIPNMVAGEGRQAPYGKPHLAEAAEQLRQAMQSLEPADRDRIAGRILDLILDELTSRPRR